MKSSSFPFSFYLTFFAVFFAFCSLGGRLVYLQVYKSDDYTKLANQARKTLSKSRPEEGISWIPRKPPRHYEIGREVGLILIRWRRNWLKFDQLAFLAVNQRRLNKPPKSYQAQRTGRKGIQKVRWVKPKDEVEEDVSRNQKLEIKGVYGNFKHSRLYPNRNLASHLLGFVNKEGIAAMGAESHADYYLKGRTVGAKVKRTVKDARCLNTDPFEVAAGTG